MAEVHKVAESAGVSLTKYEEKVAHPSRLHSPSSFCLQQASLKSLTGDNSQWSGRIAYHLSFSPSSALDASASHSYRA